MIAECLVIFGIVFVMFIIFLRTNREHALLTAPIAVLPGVNILAYLFSEPVANILPVDHFTTYVIMNILAVTVSSVLVGIFSLKLSSKTTRIAYVVMCIAFNITLASILIHNMSKLLFM